MGKSTTQNFTHKYGTDQLILLIEHVRYILSCIDSTVQWGVEKGNGELLRTTQLILLLEDYTIHSSSDALTTISLVQGQSLVVHGVLFST